jgi:hypothetical protein
VSSTDLGGATPSQVSLEYTRGTAAFFPTFPTSAVQAGLQNAVTSVNGEEASGITIQAQNAPGTATVSISQGQAPGVIEIAVSAQPLCCVATGYPPAPEPGFLMFRSDLSKLALWTGSAWVTVTLS